jgi:hypothetical protein
MITVKFGVGEEYPGKALKSQTLQSEDECFTEEVRQHFKESQASISKDDDDSFVWVSVTDSSGNSLFELEDKLTEWLDD